MQYQVECFENVDAFALVGLWSETQEFERARFSLRRVMNLTVEAETIMGAADEAFHIANAPSEPTDVNGVTWDHQRVRSMSSGDVVVVHTPDGPVPMGCLFMGWAQLPSDMIPPGVTNI